MIEAMSVPAVRLRSPYEPAHRGSAVASAASESGHTADVVQLLGPAGAEVQTPSSLHSWTKVGMLAALAMTSLAGLAACAPASPPPPPPACSAVAPSATNQAATAMETQSHKDSLQFQVIPEGTHRIDIIRQTTTEEDSDGDKHEEDVPLAQTGVYLGHGLFHDTHGNLSFIPEMAFDEPFTPSGASSVCVDGPWSNDHKIKPEGERLLLDGPWSADYRVERSGDRVKVDGPWSEDYLITGGSGNEIKIDGPWSADYTFTRIGDTIRSNGPWSDDYTVKVNGSTVIVDGPWGNDWKITRDGDQIKVDGPWGNDHAITRQGDTITVDGPVGQDFKIQREGNTVKVDGPWGADYTRQYAPRKQ